jgi:hypothetical protein
MDPETHKSNEISWDGVFAEHGRRKKPDGTITPGSILSESQEPPDATCGYWGRVPESRGIEEEGGL